MEDPEIMKVRTSYVNSSTLRNKYHKEITGLIWKEMEIKSNPIINYNNNYHYVHLI